MNLLVLTDTIIHIIQQTNPAKEQGFFATYGSLLSPIIVICTFVFNTWYTAHTKKKESDRAWYLKAYFENQIKKVDEFFSGSDKLFHDKSKTYFDLPEQTTPEDKAAFAGQFLSELADLKRKFEIEVLEVLKYTYPTIFEKINSSILDFEDAGTLSLEKDNANNAYYSYIHQIYEIKAKLIILLSQPALVKAHSPKPASNCSWKFWK